MVATFLLTSITKSVYSQIQYDHVFTSLSNMLQGNKNISFKNAVFEVENAYYDGKLSIDSFQNDISYLIKLASFNEQIYQIKYDKKDKYLVQKWSSVFKTITDTLSFGSSKDSIEYQLLPYRYDFEDVFGEKKWENMFVTKLLETRKGNCHSMPYLYKILCEELQIPCFLALAPNHIYIKHRSENAGMYNTELTSASFPIDAWLMASGYITLESIQNGVYMDALDDKKCIALCVLDLAKGFDRKYPNNDGSFILKCCDLTLEHFPNCINALLIQVETKKKRIENAIKQRGITPSVFKLLSDGKLLWSEMNELYGRIHKLGYRTMPEKMYVDWIISLKKEREKYSNKQMSEMNKN
jgi:hypothetical protein